VHADAPAAFCSDKDAVALKTGFSENARQER